MMTVDTGRVAYCAMQIIAALGEDICREGLKDTPWRVARMWKEFIEYNPGNLSTSFEDISTDQMVVVKGIRVYSMCEHHLLPFTCEIAIGYITRKRVLGLSKFSRIAHKYAHRLQLQERLVHQIADEVVEATESPDVAVYAEGEHMCTIMRGIKTPSTMCTSVMRGVFLDNHNQARTEFLALIR
jgi:GTP cyclohydrolase I